MQLSFFHQALLLYKDSQFYFGLETGFLNYSTNNIN